MKIKAVEIARKLNISKATVSLALNNRPGVSLATREAVYRCLAEMEEAAEPHAKQIVKVVYIQGDLDKYAEMDLWTEVYEGLDRGLKKLGYTLGITYADVNSPEEIEQAIKDANEENVAGVILCGTDLQPEHVEIAKQIHKPMVIHDNDFGQKYHCTVVDNVAAVRDLVDLLVSRGCRNIKYLGCSVDIYNFRERRAGFRAGFRKNRLELKEDSIVLMGKNTCEVYHNMLSYLQMNKLPDAFIMDNYQVSVGVMMALKELHISVPRDVSLVGIDEIPSIVMADYTLTTVRVHHKAKGKAVLMLLEQEMAGNLESKFRILSHCELQIGNSIK